jgi:hypothetical protein
LFSFQQVGSKAPIENVENRKISRLEELSMEAYLLYFKNESTAKIEPKIQQFLSEDSIIERTQDCPNYFSQHITSLGTTVKVSWILAFQTIGDILKA